MAPQETFLSRITPSRVLLILFVFAGVWLLMRYLQRLFESLAQARPRMRFLVRLVEPVVRILLWFGATLFAVEMVAPSQDAFLAALGSAAIAIGLGAQDLIKNLIGGFVIVADRPYQLGDRVELEGAYGEIQHIGLRSTKLMTPDDTLVTVPNSAILTSTAKNANAGVPECLVVTQLYLPTGIDPDVALEIGREALFTSPYMCLRQRTAVAIEDNYNETPFMVLRIKGYVYDHRYEPAMQTDITRRCKAEFKRRGLLADWTGEHFGGVNAG
ncbi:MAG: mechanosensitive ion channel [Bryobacteraceae bacterium]|nr:mechanosensitive ion channel [Bryobacteraceae bacterium]